MVWYQIEARDGLVLRDGRPNADRSESQTIDFPYPSTVAGGVRTALGTVRGGTFDPAAKDAVLRAKLRGPLLASTDVSEVFVRAPSDALFVQDNSVKPQLRALRPISGVDDTDMGGSTRLSIVGLPSSERLAGKPAKNAPTYWSWRGLLLWLSKPLAERSHADAETFTGGGLAGLPQEPRLHVSITQETGTATEGQLFETSALRLTRDAGGKGFPETLTLAVDVDVSEVDPHWQTLNEGTRPLGGKRKLVHWSESTAAPQITQVPALVLDAVNQNVDKVLIRVVLLTPAHFEKGSLPTFLLEPRCGVTVRLEAACVGRPETISGWDFALNKPKPSRRLVSAGSVYWLELSGEPLARRRWVEEMWMTNVSDGEQERRDGFGLAVMGVGS